jgi:TRAP-type mannitol/chloroaromatic compound transport system substrate-binding protein
LRRSGAVSAIASPDNWFYTGQPNYPTGELHATSFLPQAWHAGCRCRHCRCPALAQGGPAISWRLASSFPKTLDTIYGSAERFTKRVAELTGGKFVIRQFAAGEIVPGLQVMDAVQAGTVEIGHTASYYYFGKDPTFAFDCAVPFGLTSRQRRHGSIRAAGANCCAISSKAMA